MEWQQCLGFFLVILLVFMYFSAFLDELRDIKKEIRELKDLEKERNRQ